MSQTADPREFRILAVRLSSMGDVIHALPAVASLKHSFPHSSVTWLVRPKWAPLLEGNPYVDTVRPLERTVAAGLKCARELRAQHFHLAVDFQGLIQTALLAAAVRADRLAGFARNTVREKPAALFYSVTASTDAPHAVDRYLELAAAAGATNRLHTFPLPQGTPEGDLPTGRFVLASPLAGWGAKQWPLEHWKQLGHLLHEIGMPLVVNGPESSVDTLRATGAQVHLSGIAGLIHATRRATAVIGVDSGPMHLAAALNKPGVAIFGPTDPARHGPYGGSLSTLRAANAETTYKRTPEIAASMKAITPQQVFHALCQSIEGRDLPKAASWTLGEARS
jgi:heptosyltransferase-1